MKAKSILILIFAVIFSSCKETNADNGNKVFRLTLDVISKQDDDFCLMYTIDGTSNFKDRVVWQHVKGSSSQQQVIFDLPQGIYPTQLRIDMGFQKTQPEITLKKIHFAYNGKNKESEGEEMRLLFRPDESKCSFDGATGVIKSIVRDRQRQIPSLYPQEVYLGPELKKLAE